MKKDVNRILLYLLLAPMFLFAWFAGYYHDTISDIHCPQAELEPVHSKNETFLQEKEVLEQGYFEMRQEKETALLEKEQAEIGCAFAKAELSDMSHKFSLLSTQFKHVQDSLMQANDQISYLIVQNKQLCEKVKSYGGEC